jgi:hypothetical protein
MAEDKDEIIAGLRDRFENHCDTLNGLIFETREVWLGRRSGKSAHGKWRSDPAELFDPDIGFKVRHRKEIPYINKSIETNLAEEIELVRELQGNLKKKFDANQFDADFAASWGLFCWFIGGFDTLLNARPENQSTARTQASGHTQEDKKAQKLWFSLLYLEFRKDPRLKKRVAIEDAIVETINYCISIDLGGDEGFGKNLFRLLLGDRTKNLDHHLSSAFGDKKFSIKQIEQAARNRAYAIPPVQRITAPEKPLISLHPRPGGEE